MKIKSLHVQMPENEYIRLKVFASMYGVSLQTVVRSALRKYLDENKISKQKL